MQPLTLLQLWLRVPRDLRRVRDARSSAAFPVLATILLSCHEGQINAPWPQQAVAQRSRSSAMPLSGFKKAVKAAPEDSVDVVLEKDATAAAVQAAADPLLPEEDPSVKRNAGWWVACQRGIHACCK